jgi:hypothetical protein
MNGIEHYRIVEINKSIMPYVPYVFKKSSPHRHIRHIRRRNPLIPIVPYVPYVFKKYSSHRHIRHIRRRNPLIPIVS